MINKTIQVTLSFQTNDPKNILEAPCLKKPWNSIPKQLNVEILTWKNNINYIKDPKQKK